MTTSYTAKLRPLSERMANGVAETKGYNGSVLNPWRTDRQKTHRMRTINKGWKLTYVADGSRTAKAYPAAVKVVDSNGDLSCIFEVTDGRRMAKPEPNQAE